MRTIQFHLMRRLAISLFYEITSRALSQPHDRCSCSISIRQLMKKKTQTEGLPSRKMADPRAASMVFGCLRSMGQEDVEWSERRANYHEGAEWARCPPAKKGMEWPWGCQTTMRALTVAKRAPSGLECAPEGWKCFAFDFHYSYFCHLMSLLVYYAILSY